MSFSICRHVGCIQLVVGVLFVSSCAGEELDTGTVAVRESRLELGCASVPADVFGDVLSILSSLEPLDPSQPQSYGSESCGGLIFEFDNPDEESLRGAWIQASAGSSVSAETLSETQCEGRALEADYWGYKDREWSKLTSASSTAGYETSENPDAGYCRLDALIEHAGTFEKLRIVARVTDGAETYPMYACLW